jgi:preprotein translocase subunit SecA
MEYKKEAFDLFQDMTERVKTTVVERLFKMQIVAEASPEMPAPTRRPATQESRGESPLAIARPSVQAGPRPASAARPGGAPTRRPASAQKIGRNDPCYCGSGVKYKKCCYLKGA